MITVPPMDVTFLNQRRQAIQQHPTQIGMDYVAVTPHASQGWYLWLYFIPAATTVPDKHVRPTTLTKDNVHIVDTTGQTDLTMEVVEITLNPNDDQGQVLPDAMRVQVREAERSGQSTSHAQSYTVQLIDVPNLDPFFDQLSFSLYVGEPSPVDSHVSLKVEPATASTRTINYLARDYQTFHKLMLDRLSVVIPAWQERNPADIGMTLVEIMAYVADYLSYYQDAVATEAYLGTARRRISVRRHARLLDYVMHEGCNARVLVQIQVASELYLPEKTTLMTHIPGQGPQIAPPTQNLPGGFATLYHQSMGETPQIFETMHATTLLPAHNELYLYTWGATEATLPQGSTSATLRQPGDIQLSPGDLLIFEEVKDPQTGVETGANLARRHAVRLTAVTSAEDAIGGALLGEDSTAIPLIEVSWQAADALPFDLCLSTVVNGTPIPHVSVARGNIVLTDHGQTMQEESLIPAIVPEPEEGRYYPHLQRANITYGAPYDDEWARTQSATSAMVQSANEAVPLLTLTDEDDLWTPQKDLLNSSRFSMDFVIETDNAGVAYLRFGDGEHGKCPIAGTAMTVSYRIGNGTSGNVGADTIAHVVTDQPGILGVRNPIPAQGGIDPESIEYVRRDAPQALQDQERAVTEADYAAIAERHPEVRRVNATLQWTGSWYTVFVTIDRTNNQPIDTTFKTEILNLLGPYRMAGYDLEIRAPTMVSLDIGLTVHVEPTHFRSTVRLALEEVFSAIDLPNGQRGFFHPDNFDFGQSVYVSQLISRAMDVRGVAWVEVTRFQRWRRPDQDELAHGEIVIGPLELARLRNDPETPEDGVILFNLEGGQ